MGRGGWLFRTGRRHWLVNPSALRAVHPEFFEAKYLSRAEGEVLLEDVQTLKARMNDLTKAFNAQRAKLREEIAKRNQQVQELQSQRADGFCTG